MGTETKINCYTDNTAPGIHRVPNIVKRSSASDFNNSCVNNGKCLAANFLTSVTNNLSVQQPSSQISVTATVPFVPIQIDENAVIQGAAKILKLVRPSWDLNFVQFKVRLHITYLR